MMNLFYRDADMVKEELNQETTAIVPRTERTSEKWS
jgi:hypothetical protein